MRRILLVLSGLIIGTVTAQAQGNALRQFTGSWTAEWVENGNSKIEQFQFNTTAIGGRVAELPFLPGLATITLCQGRDCAGGNIVVGGTGFDCVYAYSIYNAKEFAWTFKTGSGGCIRSAKFKKDPPL
jgi:hypothetical protein